MASSAVVPEEQFWCAVCQQVLADPVTTPCGHNFCQTCIRQRWDRSQVCQCPTCGRTFRSRPETSVNAAFKELTEAFRNLLVHPPAPPPPGAVVNLPERMCEKHERLLEVFCRDEQRCVCRFCTETEHKHHHSVAVEDESAVRKVQIKQTLEEFQQMIQERLSKAEEIQNRLQLSAASAAEDLENCDRLFESLIRSVQERRGDVRAEIRSRQKEAERRAESLIGQLQREAAELQRRTAGLEELLDTEDHLHLLQVEVGAKTFWDLGVVRESAGRKGMITSTPENGFWTVRLRSGEEYRALDSPSVLLTLPKRPRVIGVFTDYEEGTVSFFDAEDQSHVYTFSGCVFSERILPFLSP
ncbi:unnamed protein product, partial [Tetraodon nigroviridis]